MIKLGSKKIIENNATSEIIEASKLIIPIGSEYLYFIFRLTIKLIISKIFVKLVFNTR